MDLDRLVQCRRGCSLFTSQLAIDLTCRPANTPSLPDQCHSDSHRWSRVRQSGQVQPRVGRRSTLSLPIPTSPQDVVLRRDCGCLGTAPVSPCQPDYPEPSRIRLDCLPTSNQFIRTKECQAVGLVLVQAEWWIAVGHHQSCIGCHPQIPASDPDVEIEKSPRVLTG